MCSLLTWNKSQQPRTCCASVTPIVCDGQAPLLAEAAPGQRGLTVHTLDASELAKAEGALTCCSLIFSETMVTR